MASAVENRRGIIFMLAAMSLFVINDVFMKLAREAYPAGQSIALRAGIAVVIGFALVFLAREGDRLRLAFRPRVLQRGIIEAFGALTFGWSLGLMPLANLTAINMASPLLIVALAVLLGMERVGWRRVVALAIGFVGVLFVVR
ncbi:MAG: DMT family transporter, partial [Proteobacteria bacterium]|nr:DMT family transporter [Pseudomonadota bacterium]